MPNELLELLLWIIKLLKLQQLRYSWGKINGIICFVNFKIMTKLFLLFLIEDIDIAILLISITTIIKYYYYYYYYSITIHIKYY